VVENPYIAPSALESEQSHANRGRIVPRPVGVSILAVLHLIGGIGLFVVQLFLFLFANVAAIEESLRGIGLPPALFVIGVMFLSVLTIASAIGMWLGTRWGWWVASFYYVYGIARNASALVTIVSVADQVTGASRGPEYYLFKHSVRIVVHILILLYLFKGCTF
jgi:hypothetical protein